MSEKTQYKNFNGLDVLDAEYHHRTFGKHVHEGYSISVVGSGVNKFDRTGCNYSAGKNSMVLINADQVHTGQSGTGDTWRYKAIYPTPELVESICKDVVSNPVPYFPSAVIEDQDLILRFARFHQSVQQGEARLSSETLLHDLIIQLVFRHGKTRPEIRQHKTHPLTLIHDYLREYFYQEISLETLSQLSGLSPFHMVRQFKIYYGMAPHAYQIQLRVQHAQNLLKAGISISTAAVTCGFHDQSHLHRHFARVVGVTPGKYRLAV